MNNLAVGEAHNLLQVAALEFQRDEPVRPIRGLVAPNVRVWAIENLTRRYMVLARQALEYGSRGARSERVTGPWNSAIADAAGAAMQRRSTLLSD